MKVSILSYGSRGDVQPYIALGLGLQRAGYRVTLAAPALFRSFVEQYGLRFAPLPGDPTELMRASVEKAPPSASPLAPLRVGAVMARYALPVARQMIDDVRAACRGADAIIHTLLLTVAGHEEAMRLGVPDFSALVFAVFAPTQSFPNALFPPFPLGPSFDRQLHVYFNRVFWWGNRLVYFWLRRKHKDLPPLTSWPFDPQNERVTPILYGFSRYVVPPPPDWGPDVRVCGYWFLDAPPDWQPPPGLRDFLDDGPPPIFIGFGSVVSRDAKKTTRMVLDALEQTGQRGLLLKGWGGLGTEDLPKSVYAIEHAPFDWLLPRMAGAVHHGGIGTTADALRAGIPSFIVPFTADQPFWGRQIAKLGLGPEPVPFRQLTVEKLASHIERLVKDDMARRRVAELGKRIRNEDGVGEAVKILGGYLHTHP